MRRLYVFNFVSGKSPGRRNCRLRFGDLPVSKWRLPGRLILSFPEPVARNLEATALRVFILYT